MHYLDSPDFAAVAAQFRINPTLVNDTEDQVRQGLRLAGVPERFLQQTTRTVQQTLVLSCQEAATSFHRHSGHIDQQDVAAAAAANSRLLMRLKSLTKFHTFASRMCTQVVALHNSIRLPHIGVSRAVRYERLYVQPGLDSSDGIHLGTLGDRTVILGDPGAGKSTLAAKFAHDVASDGSHRVPFLVVLREFVETFGSGGHELLHYLEMLCQAPYNVKAPPDAVEYLLRSGRAVVVLDGLDEIVQTELRRRVVALVEGFAHLYPLVPILVTARRIGYEDAPLNQEQFATAHILQFAEKQVKAYVRQWFALDEASSPAERKRLASSFIEDSDQIVELRSNPLLLALLCAMYSSDRYLPHNLAQVYERCALMLFEQWDAKRGVPLPLKFHGRLRGAVQHLAWRMFTATESGKAQSRTRIVKILTQYLEDKLDDHDESMATAEEFLLFCTGRAWILTDVGATTTEPRFGFTHRTFLEYFAAEHLVRTHRTAKDLWATLRPSIDQWDVVGQVVLQLYDRNIENGVDELLAEAFSEGGLDFAARSLRYVHPSTRTVRAITERALHKAVCVPPSERASMGFGDHDSKIDATLHNCMHECSPANLPVVEQTVISGAEALLDKGILGAMIALELMESRPRSNRRWTGIQQDIKARYASAITEITSKSPSGAIFNRRDGEALSQIVRRGGVSALYLNWSFHNFTIISPGLSYLVSSADSFQLPAAELLATTMAEQPTPWANAEQFERAAQWIDMWTKIADGFHLMLSLPFLELPVYGRSVAQLPAVYGRLMRGRRTAKSRGAALRWIEQTELSATVRQFLAAWVRGEISVTEPVPQPQLPPQAPR